MPNKRNFTDSYLYAQVSAMKWLKEQGLTPEQIKDMRWGMVDESNRCIYFPTSVTSLKMDLKTGEITKNTEIKNVPIYVKGSGHEWFFLKSKFKCAWMFTRQVPKSWRKEKSREDCYSLEAVENLTKDVFTPVISPLFEKIDELTKTFKFRNIRVSIANITNPEAKEQAGESAKAKSWRENESHEYIKL